MELPKCVEVRGRAWRYQGLIVSIMWRLEIATPHIQNCYFWGPPKLRWAVAAAALFAPLPTALGPSRQPSMAVAPRVDPKKEGRSNVCRDAVLLICGLVLAAAVFTWVQARDEGREGLAAAAEAAAGGGGGAAGGRGGDSGSGSAGGARGLAAAAAAAVPLLGGARGLAPAKSSKSTPVFKTFIRDICNGTDRYPEEAPDYDVMGKPGSSTEEWDAPDCHWSEMWHPAVPMKPMNVCTHDPKIDTVISHFLHTYHFWGSPDDYLILLATGPCTPERPYMMDIGANLGVYSILGASRGCHLVAFEPLSQNILRLKASLDENGWGERSLLYKHAVGKSHATVRIGFRPSNPGASALGHGGDEEEVIDQITIDNLLLGKNPPVFKAPKGARELPPFLGRYINFVKIDTEGYDTAVFDGALSTLMEGRVPHILIEFTPGDAQGTAGCDSWNFMRLIYANKYRMYEFRCVPGPRGCLAAAARSAPFPCARARAHCLTPPPTTTHTHALPPLQPRLPPQAPAGEGLAAGPGGQGPSRVRGAWRRRGSQVPLGHWATPTPPRASSPPPPPHTLHPRPAPASPPAPPLPRSLGLSATRQP